MTGLFEGRPRPLPAPEGPTWTISSDDPPKPDPVQHASGYEAFVAFAVACGIDPVDLLDTWLFAHFIRKHRRALKADAALRRSAVVFLGNAVIRVNPDLVWHVHTANGLFVENITTLEPVDGNAGEWRVVPDLRHLGVERTVEALLDADLERLREFGRVVEDFGWSADTTLRPV